MTVVSKKKHEMEPEQELPVEDLKAEAEQAAEQTAEQNAEQTPAEPETAAAEPETDPIAAEWSPPITIGK